MIIILFNLSTHSSNYHPNAYKVLLFNVSAFMFGTFVAQYQSVTTKVNLNFKGLCQCYSTFNEVKHSHCIASELTNKSSWTVVSVAMFCCVYSELFYMRVIVPADKASFPLEWGSRRTVRQEGQMNVFDTLTL